uniref:translation initiation factor IF-2-like n=1 Tax=Nyctereutes procyonoides TaxID=34880 RepID=UPI002444BBED|nr:translation initiation factor IF-2-like [Nyctereutes procyonoides]
MAVPRRSDEASAGRRAAASGPPRPGEERRPRRPAPPGLRRERAAPGRRGSLSGCRCGGLRAGPCCRAGRIGGVGGGGVRLSFVRSLVDLLAHPLRTDARLRDAGYKNLQLPANQVNSSCF